MRTTGPRLPIALTALALAGGLLTACSGGGGGLKAEDSPLSQYLMAASGGNLSEEEQTRRFNEQQKKQQEIIAACMTKEGFEYTPFTGGSSISFGNDGQWDPDSRAWVEKYGYGAVNSPWQEESDARATEPPEDPNQKYVTALSESEQRAYYETLSGKSPDPAELSEGGSYEWKWEEAGCQGKAQHEVMGEDPWQKDEFASLRDRMSKFWEDMQNAPEMKALDAKWAACMKDAGEPGFAKQGDAAQSIYDAQNKIYEAVYGDGSKPVDPATTSDPSKSPEMKELGERELVLAKKDFECREKTSYRDEQLKAQFALEEKFIAENKAELDAFKAAAEQQSK